MLYDLLTTVNTWMAGTFGLALFGCFLWGMISVILSPCHMASIPLIMGYVAGQEKALQARSAARYAVVFTLGLFITIALLGIACTLLGRMLGDVSPYWTLLMGGILIWVALDMLGVEACAMSGGALSKLQVRGLFGAFVLGLAYGILSGSCTFGFMAPILAVITIQEKIAAGILLVVAFGIGHCVPIAVAGSSTALIRRLLTSQSFQSGSLWFKKGAGVIVGGLGCYFIVRPFI
ncbi:cytochrome c biogenesis CcdA family protein [Desulfoluna butyratoxydans]|uniref:Cytochrome c biogenesis protein transmembrane domain n=1 Tax=Desulfoluna butyratoxydans TaxID=231438 RepID=A0A4U8YI04_9BACT|nr:cytochrome c biogenesis protein CcdA [Desulfoluna butyratoxydans]VFQ43275.1 cytochrome c biogenesis protein transmembrane domain [Desulfoluna butyratoxydans]